MPDQFVVVDCAGGADAEHAVGDYVASGAINSEADPNSNLAENWPTDVQTAIANIQSFATENC